MNVHWCGGWPQRADLREALLWKMCLVSPVSRLRELYCCGGSSVVVTHILKGSMC